ncbi:adenylate/guanylate cyclase domain-containing protein [Sinimarinibacterium sp. CAU 1509]|uniref:adenylate/guanylate cyclase domain-containing protein n=1 Tax=Sinimarinibacterium sp. CAU 1509 TaxID=2562283 RepID=UPI0010AB9B55|nr:adenylate/guanylate cyclase domain-containing protein [Sinimarinibacterium sp. CAU 1509]TJY61011.1 adenylate/guanylate cyclase domain-containing protein [Sinimarinibacterium sp. CAU 1509]
MAAAPETRFATVGDDRVAYQVLGDGPRDLLMTTGFWSNLDTMWEEPAAARFFRRLASFSRLIMFDRRGAGLSDPPSNSGLSPVDHWDQDCMAVLDAAGSSAPIIFGTLTVDAGVSVLEFVSRHPERCSGLILGITAACMTAKPGYPQGFPPEVVERIKASVLKYWGTAQMSALFIPSQAQDEALMRWSAKYQRAIASPAAMAENLESQAHLDARHLLPQIHVPTLVMARRNFSLIPVAQTRYLADHIPGARFVELPGSDGIVVFENPDIVLGHIEEFVTGRRHGAEPERALLTVLFTDIVDSTRCAADKGDSEWRVLLEKHDRAVREQVALYQGRFVESSGDGTLSTFERPERAIDCAQALQEAVTSLGINIRAGVHAGNVELREGDRIGGIAVHIAARVMAQAGAGEVVVSRTVRDILLGSRYTFSAFGRHVLKGVPDEWELFRLEAPGSP